MITYTDKPNLGNNNDIYYTGCGPDWGIDLDGNRYYKKYHPAITNGPEYKILCHGDLVNEEERVRRIVDKYLIELGIKKINS